MYSRIFNLPALFSIYIIFIFFCSTSLGQESLSNTQKKQIIDSLFSKVTKLYPIAEIGKKIGLDIIRNYENGKYSNFNSPDVLVQQLNKDLEYSSKDGHLGIIYDPALAAELKREKDSAGKVESYADFISELERWNNYGFKELKILEGNIGYLNLTTFFSLKYAGETAVSVINFFSNCGALIIDLRSNGGGWDEMVTFLASYFVDNDDDIIYSITRSTADDFYFASKLSSYVPGKKLTDIPVVILTSRSTASAAEAFANLMKNFNRNTSIIGETTAGAEYPVNDYPLFAEYILRIPTLQKIFTYNYPGWEGKGIKPDIEIEYGNALPAAHIFLLNKLKDTAKDESVKNKYLWYLEGIEALNRLFVLPESLIKTYTGKYGNRDIHYENDALYYQYKGRAKRKMIPINSEYFLIEGIDSFRIKFLNESDRIVRLNIIYDDGRIIKLTKE